MSEITTEKQNFYRVLINTAYEPNTAYINENNEYTDGCEIYDEKTAREIYKKNCIQSENGAKRHIYLCFHPFFKMNNDGDAEFSQEILENWNSEDHLLDGE